jgi:CheY-like chemotaxis protein
MTPQDSAAGVPHILLVEDNLDDIILTRRAFKKAGLTASLWVVEDGELALDYLAGTGAYRNRDRHPWPALVLLDLKLPKKPGLEVLRWVRAQPKMKDLPIVVLTSSRQLEDIERAYALGANSYLEKPVDLESLQKLVSALHLYWLRLNVTSTHYGAR